MKTTIELEDSLLIEAKQVAHRQRTTLKAILEHALRRELYGNRDSKNRLIEMNTDGMPLLKRRGAIITSEKVRQIMEAEGI